MKWSVRGACAALSSCLLLACALSAAAVGLKCFSLGSELRGEPFRLGAAAGAFYSGLLLAAGLSLLGAALLCCGPRDAPLEGPGPGPGLGVPAAPTGAPEAAPGEPGAAAGSSGPVNSQNLLLLGVLVFMLGVLSAFAGAVIDGDTVSLVERKYSHYCLPPRAPAAAPGPAPGPAAAAPGPAPGAPRARSTLDSATSAKCRQLKDYQRGLVLSTVFNSLECLLGLLSLLLVKNYKSSQARRGRRGRRRGGRALARPRSGPGLRAQPPASRARRGRRGRRGGGCSSGRARLPSCPRRSRTSPPRGTARASRRTTLSPTSTWASSTRSTRRAWRCAAGGTHQWSCRGTPPRTPTLTPRTPTAAGRPARRCAPGSRAGPAEPLGRPRTDRALVLLRTRPPQRGRTGAGGAQSQASPWRLISRGSLARRR
uniref:Transmembrane protein 271 n=1 Tax=Equus asinus TaxID=9793 RepID=A0A9L0K0L1_EQUAS